MMRSKLFLAAILVCLPACGLVCGAEANLERTAAKEFYPSALLEKYEWFKDAAAALDAKQATLKLYAKRKQSLLDQYAGLPRIKWAREDREQFNQWEAEEAGFRAIYNKLAGEYNSQMSKFNWRFTNVGDVPPGGQPLPREFRPYEEN